MAEQYTKLAPASTDSRDETLVIRELIPGMVTFSLPFVCHLHLRTSASALVHIPSSAPLAPACCR
jgi:hypothetical protein